MSKLLKMLIILVVTPLCVLLLLNHIEDLLERKSILGHKSGTESICGATISDLFYRTPVYPDIIQFRSDGIDYVINLYYGNDVINDVEYPIRIVRVKSGKVEWVTEGG